LPVFCIPKTLAASFFPVSTQIVIHIPIVFLSKHCADRFFCGGFSSTAGYVPGNEAHLLALMSDFCSFLVVPCQKAFPVFIRVTRKSFSTFS
jgi:hypothetical protein